MRATLSAAARHPLARLRSWWVYGTISVRTLRLLFSTTPLVATLFTTVSLLTVVLELTCTILTGVVIAMVPAAVHDGLGGSAGHHLLLGVAAYALAYVLQSVVYAVSDLAGNWLVLRVNGSVRGRVAAALLRDPTLETVENDVMQDLASVALAGPD